MLIQQSWMLNRNRVFLHMEKHSKRSQGNEDGHDLEGGGW
jgi:hypothetical protein